jgi:diadenosine tetraphosphate (Ap4A) HIT family hydrolase
MPESPEDLYARVTAQAGEGGRLACPPIAEWETFPWDGVISTRPLLPPVAEEPRRAGEGGQDCHRCLHPDRDVIWANERWTVSSTPRPTGLPLVLFLMPRDHLDFSDLDEDLAAECGRLSVRLARIVESLPEIGRVHTFKIGDGAEHLHLWFLARPARIPQLMGSFAVEWDDILPPVPEPIWRVDLATVAARLVTHEGTAPA